MSNYVGVVKNEGKWFGVTDAGERVLLTHVPKARRVEHLIDENGAVVGKRCTHCKKMELATSEYFHSDKRRFLGLRSKCKKCFIKLIEMNDKGLAIDGTPKRAGVATKVSRFYNEAGECTHKACTLCGEVKDRISYHAHTFNIDGLQEHCIECRNDIACNSRVSKQNYRALKVGLPGTLTPEMWTEILTVVFDGKCALTGDPIDLAFEHLISLSSGQGGTTAWNCYPISRRLNLSKGTRNFFEWIELPHIRAQVDPAGVTKLIEHLANQCEMSVNEYKDFYNWMFRNQGPSYEKTGLSSLSYYKKFVRTSAS